MPPAAFVAVIERAESSSPSLGEPGASMGTFTASGSILDAHVQSSSASGSARVGDVGPRWRGNTQGPTGGIGATMTAGGQGRPVVP